MKRITEINFRAIILQFMLQVKEYRGGFINPSGQYFIKEGTTNIFAGKLSINNQLRKLL
jgi:hypothetical protein